MTPESLRQAATKHKMSVSEAQKILGVESGATLGEIRERFERLFEVNEKQGTFYLQSKVYRAKERLEAELRAREEDAESAGKG
eukprot:CAMPEP_0177606854 /NCGR_PEP_ID=MMETSP0419_2-20121207/17548_1 /TAXON_ID=582737 /ORGANISM="Tetraselmis sp., Strain GSL018" /LENGTH=82 /DNA_ID=CAMNT_0019101281 /DNA_START=212 /DNA_END=460 /DNA_ORIENTATION=-